MGFTVPSGLKARRVDLLVLGFLPPTPAGGDNSFSCRFDRVAPTVAIAIGLHTQYADKRQLEADWPVGF